MLVSASSSSSVFPGTDQQLDETTWNGDTQVIKKKIEFNEYQNFNGACVDSEAKIAVIRMP